MLHTANLPPETTPFRPIAEVAKNLQNQQSAHPQELLNADRHRVLLLTVQPGDTLLEQYHLYADKTLMVLEGCARISSTDSDKTLHEGDTTTIAFATPHRISNIGKIPLRLLEIRTGACVEDDDTAT